MVFKAESIFYVPQGGHFSGIYRKVQLKPQKWTMVASDDDDSEVEMPSEALMVLKYGGVLTHAGRKQVSKRGYVVLSMFVRVTWLLIVRLPDH